MSTQSVIEKIMGKVATAHVNLQPTELVAASIGRGEVVLNDTGALMADTGDVTVRPPK